MAKTSTSTLDTRINEIVARTAAEISRAVRDNIADEIARVLGNPGRNAPARATGAPPAAARPAAAPGRRGRKPVTRADKLRKGWSEADVERVHGFIGSQPGLRSEQIGKALKIPPKALFKVLAKLRETRRVNVKGYGRGGTYTVA